MKSRSTPQHPVQLHVEALEARLTPDATTYVEGLYQTVLQRAGSATEVAGWVTLMRTLQQQQDNSNNQGTLTTQQLDQQLLVPNGSIITAVAAAFWLSPEHRGLEVDNYYQHFLKRADSATERQEWVNVFVSGGVSEVQVEAAFLSSQEYQNLYPGDTAFVDALYQDVLGRAADPNGAAGWVQLLESSPNGGSRNSVNRGNVALDILTSPEGETVTVTQDYQQLLNRAPTRRA